MLMVNTFASEAQREAGGTPPGRTGLVESGVYLEHKTGVGHPEQPERLTAIHEGLRRSGVWSNLVLLAPEPAAREWLTAVHTAAYVDHVRRSSEGQAGYLDSPDTPVSTESYKAALMAVGGVLRAVDAVMTGRVDNAFCAVRPPGHHASRERAMGFCLFNNVAIAARYLQRRHHLGKVLIVDWDVHHGNGTQAAFYDDPSVFYFSVHQSPLYPGTGGAEENGEGRGLGTTLNVPLPAGSGDTEYLRAVESALRPAADAFQPEFVLISAGFDAAQDDLLGRMKVTPEGYARLTRAVRAIAQRHCRGRVVAVLEGGYYLPSLSASVEAHVRALVEP